MEYSDELGNFTLSDEEMEYMMEEYGSQIPGPPRAIAVFGVALLYCLIVAANTMLIFASVSRKESRDQSGKWLLVNMAVCLMMEAIILVGYSIHQDVGIPPWYNVAGLCEFVALLQRFFVFAAANAILVVTVERYISISKNDGLVPGLSKNVTILIIIATDIFTIIFILIADFAIGDGFLYEDLTLLQMGEIKCVLMSSFMTGLVYDILYFLILLSIMMLTIFAGAKSCSAKSTQISRAALPLVVANTCFVLLELPSVIASLVLHLGAPFIHGLQYVWYSGIVFSILVPLLWLGLSRDLRRSYREACCPCCPHSDQEEATYLLKSEDAARN